MYQSARKRMTSSRVITLFQTEQNYVNIKIKIIAKTGVTISPKQHQAASTLFKS